MSEEEFISFFKMELERNNLDILNIDYKKMYIYMKEILKWNECINLTAIKNEQDFIIKHFVDSLTVLEFINQNDKVLDLGTGAGFPGIPIKLSKDVDIVLLDSINKKLDVIRQIIQSFNLNKIECIHGRAEDIARDKKYREQFDVVVARAVSNLPTLLEYMMPFVKVGGKVICMKGPNVEEELENSKVALKVLCGTIEKIEKKNIDDELVRNIVVIKKNSSTPNKYPRGQGKPLKSPII